MPPTFHLSGFLNFDLCKSLTILTWCFPGFAVLVWIISYTKSWTITESHHQFSLYAAASVWFISRSLSMSLVGQLLVSSFQDQSRRRGPSPWDRMWSRPEENKGVEANIQWPLKLLLRCSLSPTTRTVRRGRTLGAKEPIAGSVSALNSLSHPYSLPPWHQTDVILL